MNRDEIKKEPGKDGSFFMRVMQGKQCSKLFGTFRQEFSKMSCGGVCAILRYTIKIRLFFSPVVKD